MLRIGLTGGIGSGKSTVAKIFSILGVPVYYADDAARRLMNEDPRLINEITKAFGPNSYIDGKLNKGFISSLVFSDPEKLQLLNSIVHPVTIADAESWMKAQRHPYAIKEAALIFETDSFKYLDQVIGVYAPLELRIQRSMNRDGLSRDEVKARIAKQMNEEEKMARCNAVLKNDETELLIPQILKIHQLFMSGHTQ